MFRSSHDTWSSPSQLKRRENEDGFLGTHTTRMMLGLAMSLSLILLAFHLPIHQPSGRVGWQLIAPPDELSLEQLGLESLARASVPTPLSVFEESSSKAADDSGEDETSQESLADSDQRDVPPERSAIMLSKMSGHLGVLDFAENMPQIVGGIGAFYINIEYPEAAAKAGIEGRLIVEFVVEKDGTPSDIRIINSLHALCDSAAVRALRETRFVPGVQNGEEVRVRMRLPVRFQLIRPPEEEERAHPSRV